MNSHCFSTKAQNLKMLTLKCHTHIVNGILTPFVFCSVMKIQNRSSTLMVTTIISTKSLQRRYICIYCFYYHMAWKELEWYHDIKQILTAYIRAIVKKIIPSNFDCSISLSFASWNGKVQIWPHDIFFTITLLGIQYLYTKKLNPEKVCARKISVQFSWWGYVSVSTCINIMICRW